MDGAGGLLVSCLMVTLPLPERFSRLCRSIQDYCRQTHPERELIVVLNGGVAECANAVKDHIAGLARSDIHVLEPGGTLTLGALRNISVSAARGAFLCQWDDDDLYHPRRLEQQLKALIETDSQAVCLQEVMQFLARSRALYCTNWRATEPKAHPGTLLCRRAAELDYPETGPEARLGEDSAALLRLQRQGGVHALVGQPYLYVYVSHGENSWGEEHHRMLATKLALSKALLKRREKELREGLQPFDFGAGPISVEGYNGSAFDLT